jgi:hypothetical protein
VAVRPRTADRDGRDEYPDGLERFPTKWPSHIKVAKRLPPGPEAEAVRKLKRARTLRVRARFSFMPRRQPLRGHGLGLCEQWQDGRRNANVSVEAWQADRARPIVTAVMNILMV